MIRPFLLARLSLLLCCAIVSCAAPRANASDAPAPDFSLGLSGALALGAAGQDSQAEPDEPPAPAPLFGEKGSSWWSVSAAGMVDDDDNTDSFVRFAYHHFLAEDFEINLAGTAWYHDQPDDDEVSASFDLGFRYHFLAAEDKRWTVYGDLGIGFMLASGDVPEGGTRYNFTPRAGFGMTMRLPDALGGNAGGRLDLGLGWQHYSNASTAGSDKNPARDSILFRAGVMFPF